MKKLFSKMDKKWKDCIVVVCVCILFYICVTNLKVFGAAIGKVFSVLRPVIIGFIIAYIINPMAVFFENKLFKGINKEKLRWILAVILTFLVVIALFVLLFAALIPQIADSAAALVERYPAYKQEITEYAAENNGIISALINKFEDYLPGENSLLSNLFNLIGDNSQTILAKSSDFGTSFFNYIIGAVFAVYFLTAKEEIGAFFKKSLQLMLNKFKYAQFDIVITKFNKIFSTYIVFEILDAAIIGVLNYLFMLVTGMPDAVLISCVAAVTNLVPTFGPVIGAAISTVILLIMKPSAIIPYLIFTVLLQLADGYIIKPKLFGSALNVPGVIILIAIIVFGKLMGIAGMLLAIPFAAIIVYLYEDVLVQKLELKKELKQYKAEKLKNKSKLETEDIKLKD